MPGLGRCPDLGGSTVCDFQGDLDGDWLSRKFENF